ncbi:MAG: LemA family protein [Spirochaetia bacterium]|jgi:LemA protein|nr:LemA family protein [Spirochaetia bacterium]
MNKKVLYILVPVLVLLLIAGSLFSWYINTRNQLVYLEENIDASWAEVDNQLQRRSDLIPNIVSTVKGFASQEKEVFTNIANARAKLAGASTVSEKAEGANQLEGALSRLLVVVENYPQLKSDQNFIRLQDELAGTENRLAVARKRYNDGVKIFNAKIRMIPASIIAGNMGLEKKPYFEVSETAKELPKVDFGS